MRGVENGAWGGVGTALADTDGDRVNHLQIQDKKVRQMPPRAPRSNPPRIMIEGETRPISGLEGATE